MRPSDFSRLFAISFFRPGCLPPVGGSREISPGNCAELHTDAVASTPARPTDMGFAAEGQLTRGLGRLCGASLSLGSVLHVWTSIGHPLAGRRRPPPSRCPCLIRVGFLRQDPKRTWFTLVFSFVHFHLMFCARAGRTIGGDGLHACGGVLIGRLRVRRLPPGR